jgi:hypothetical protein
MFPDLDLQQPEFTLLELDDTVLDESKYWWEDGGGYSNVTNLDNMTGYKTKTKYEPSGHIKSILNGCHRYLTKVTTPGSTLKIALQPQSSNKYEQSLNARKNNGAMTVIQLADDDSRYYAKGYDKQATRKTADLSGDYNKGIIMAKIPHFWYKGLNYNTPVYNTTLSKRFIAFSTYEEKPARSSEIKEIKFEDLYNNFADSETDGKIREGSGLQYYESPGTINERYVDQGNIQLRSNVYRVKVEGYKKIMLPCDPSVSNGATIFTTADGTICTNKDGNTVNYGEYKKMTWMFVDTCMPIVLTIPPEAVYVYFTIGLINWGDAAYGGASRLTAHNVVLHKGSNFASGDEMTDTNASEWLVDMEDWVEHKETFVGIDACTKTDTGYSLTLNYSNSKTAAGGAVANSTLVSLSDDYVYSPYHFAKLIYNIGYQTYEYTDQNILKILFLAKYGRKNIESVFGFGTTNYAYSITVGGNAGINAKIGMREPFAKIDYTSQSAIAYQYDMSENQDKSDVFTANCNNFLGVSNAFYNGRFVFPFSHLIYNQDELDAKTTTVNNDARTMFEAFKHVKLYDFEDGSFRWLKASNAYSYAKYMRFGRYCDFVQTHNATHAGTFNTGYCDAFQIAGIMSTASLNACGCVSAGGNGGISKGVFDLEVTNFGYETSQNVCRLAFKGSITEVDDPDYFNEVQEYRQPE